jgi:hypothetical protein
MVKGGGLRIISPATPSVGISPSVLMENELVLGIILWLDGFIWAHKGTRPAAVAITLNIGDLPDNINDLPGKFRFRDHPF